VTLWLVLLGMALVTFALRAAFLVLPPGVEMCRMNNFPPALSQSL